MDHVAELQRRLPATRDFVWAIVHQNLNGVADLVPVRISSRDDGERAFNRINSRLGAIKQRSCAAGLLATMFTKKIASTATIRYATRDRGRRGHDPLFRVYLEDQHFDVFLTDTIQNPHLLYGDVGCLGAHSEFLFRPDRAPHYFAGQKVLVVGPSLDKSKVAGFLILLLVVSPSLGVFVGICTHRADVGVAVSGAILALSALLQPLAVWFVR